MRPASRLPIPGVGLAAVRVLFPVLITPQCTDLVATRYTVLSSVFFT
jgi:hypothetical protein